jgi:hypothetical protein
MKYTVSVRDAAERSGFSPQQILNRINLRKNRLPAKKVGGPGGVWLLAEATVKQLIEEKQKQPE